MIERKSAVSELLIFFMTFASDQNDIPRLCELNCAGNCLAPVKYRLESLNSEAGLDISYDLSRILFSGFVRRDDRIIRVLISSGSHQRAFTFVSIPSAAEHQHQAIRAQLTAGFSPLEERARG